MTPSELADSLRELCREFKNDLSLISTHLGDLEKMADQIAALKVAPEIDPRFYVDIPAPIDPTKPMGGWYAPR